MEVVIVTVVIASSTINVAQDIAALSGMTEEERKAIVVPRRTRVAGAKNATQMTCAGTAVASTHTALLENVIKGAYPWKV